MPWAWYYGGQPALSWLTVYTRSRPRIASWFWALAWIILAAFGIFTQIRYHRTYEFDKSHYVADWG